MRTRLQAAAAPTLASFPDDIFLQVIAAFSDTDDDDPPLFDAVKKLACLSKALLQQLHRLRPLVGVRSLAVVQRPAHGPWRVTLLYGGKLTAAVLEQARQGRVRSIDTVQNTCDQLAPAVARRVVPELLGAGCSLLELDLTRVPLNGTWATTFGEAAVCSAVLRSLRLQCCGLRGPLPELRLPALQQLDLSYNKLTGGLEPLQGCTALRELWLFNNKLTGGLDALRGCTALETLFLSNNKLTGGLEALRGCTALEQLNLHSNKLSGGLEPLRVCTALQHLNLCGNKLSLHLEPLRGCTALQVLCLYSKHSKNEAFFRALWSKWR